MSGSQFAPIFNGLKIYIFFFCIKKMKHDLRNIELLFFCIAALFSMTIQLSFAKILRNSHYFQWWFSLDVHLGQIFFVLFKKIYIFLQWCGKCVTGIKVMQTIIIVLNKLHFIYENYNIIFHSVDLRRNMTRTCFWQDSWDSQKNKPLEAHKYKVAAI